MKKIKVIMAAVIIITAAAALTACEMSLEIGTNKNNTSASETQQPKETEKNESDEQTEETSQNSSDVNDNDRTEPSNNNGGTDVTYEPVVNKIGDIITEGELQYFNCTSEYGNAFTTVYRYIYKNGKLDGAEFGILPGEVKDLETIIDKMGGSIEASKFSESANGWSLTMNAFELDPMFQDADIEDLYALMQMSVLSSSD